MTLRKRIIIFHDSALFGGHELAFFKFFDHLLRSDNILEVRFIYYENNARLKKVLAEYTHPKLTLVPGPYRNTRASALSTPFRWYYQRYVTSCYQRMSPDTVLLLQGRIEGTMVPMAALPPTADVVTYIPMAHMADELGKGNVSGSIMDKVRRRYYRRPQRLITPSHASAEQLRRAGATGRIYVVPNSVSSHTPPDKAVERARFGVPISKRVALFLGRFDTWQKGLDNLLSAIERDAANLQDWHFLFVGEGPGESIVRSTLGKLAADASSVHGWTDRPRDILASSDVLMMPSRFEGVPLSMLEALSDGVPILATDIDVFTEHLPRTCLWDFKTPPGLIQRLDALTQDGPLADFRAHAGEKLLRMSAQNPANLFEKAILGF